MASRTFTWDAGDGTSAADWTNSANWTGVGSGYPGDSVGTHVDTVIIPTGQDKCYVNAAIVIYDLTLNGVQTDTLVELQANLEVTHDFLITSGIMNLGAGSYTFTVGGDLTLDPVGAGTSTDATLTCGNADIDAGKLETSGVWHSGGYTPKAVFTGGTGDHTFGSVHFLVGTNVVLSSGVTEITGTYGGAAFRADVQTGYNTWDNGDGTVKFTSSSDQLLYSTSAAASDFTTFYNLILEKTSSTLQGLSTVGFDIKVENDLTITSGILNTNTTTGVNFDLTVEGTTTIGPGATSTLILNGSTCLFNTGGTAGGLALNANATVTSSGSSTVTMGSIISSYDSSIDITLAGTNVVNHYQSSTDKIMKLPPGVIVGTTTSFTITTKAPATNCEVSCADEDFQNLTFTPDSATATQYNLDSGYGGINIAGNLTLYEGATLNGNNQPVTVGGTFLISSGSYLGGTVNNTCGGIKVYNSGSFSATSGETIINDGSLEYGDFGGGDVRDDENIRFIHNNGTVVLSGSSCATKLSSPEDSNVPGIAGGSGMPSLSNTYGVYNLKAKTTSTFSLGGAGYIGISGDFDINTAGYGWTDRQTRVGGNLNLNQGELRIDGNTKNLWVDGNINMSASTKLGGKRSDGSHPHWLGWMMCDGDVTLGASSELYLASGTSASDKFDFTGTQIGGNWINNGGTATE